MVADDAEVLANRRSARSEAMMWLTGRARWCLVDHENMSFVENASDRMRVSLGGILMEL